MYRLFSVRALPVRNEDGTVREWVGVHTDITEDRERQQTLRDTVTALRQQQELVDAAQRLNDAGFWRFQPSNSGLYLSPGSRHLLGLPLTGEISMEEARTAVHPDDLARSGAAMQQALRGGEYRLEFRVVLSSGENRWLLSVARMVELGGEDRYLVGMHLDITTQKRSAEALMRTEKLAVAGRLAATIAHEINNPLEAVTNLLYLLQSTALDRDQQAYCALMADELRRVGEITTHTLRFHRQTTRPAHIRVEDLLESVLALFGGRLRNASVEVECRFRKTREVFGYDGELRQVIANLVGNAVDAMSGGPIRPRRLLLRAREETRGGRAGVVVTVADTGPGIATATLQHIFDPFFTTKGEFGTGLGLWVTTEIVNKHGGTLQVRSYCGVEKSGTVFRVFLPQNGM